MDSNSLMLCYAHVCWLAVVLAALLLYPCVHVVGVCSFWGFSPEGHRDRGTVCSADGANKTKTAVSEL